jgi:hypothetical protein
MAVAVGIGVGVDVSVGIAAGSITAVEEEATGELLGSESALFVPQAFSINKAINTNQ